MIVVRSSSCGFSIVSRVVASWSTRDMGEKFELKMVRFAVALLLGSMKRCACKASVRWESREEWRANRKTSKSNENLGRYACLAGRDYSSSTTLRSSYLPVYDGMLGKNEAVRAANRRTMLRHRVEAWIGIVNHRKSEGCRRVSWWPGSLGQLSHCAGLVRSKARRSREVRGQWQSNAGRRMTGRWPTGKSAAWSSAGRSEMQPHADRGEGVYVACKWRMAYPSNISEVLSCHWLVVSHDYAGALSWSQWLIIFPVVGRETTKRKALQPRNSSST